MPETARFLHPGSCSTCAVAASHSNSLAEHVFLCARLQCCGATYSGQSRAGMSPCGHPPAPAGQRNTHQSWVSSCGVTNALTTLCSRWGSLLCQNDLPLPKPQIHRNTSFMPVCQTSQWVPLPHWHFVPAYLGSSLMPGSEGQALDEALTPYLAVW